MGNLNVLNGEKAEIPTGSERFGYVVKLAEPTISYSRAAGLEAGPPSQRQCHGRRNDVQLSP